MGATNLMMSVSKFKPSTQDTSLPRLARTLRPDHLQDDSQYTVGVSINELLLRGCTLKNSGFVMGLVVYTGHETRIQMNSSDPPHKTGAPCTCNRCDPYKFIPSA